MYCAYRDFKLYGFKKGRNEQREKGFNTWPSALQDGQQNFSCVFGRRFGGVRGLAVHHYTNRTMV